MLPTNESNLDFVINCSYSPYSAMQDSFPHANQLSTVVESQKLLMVMFKDLTQRIGTLENTVSDLTSKVDSGSGTSTSNEEKMRIPSVHTVRKKKINESVRPKSTSNHVIGHGKQPTSRTI